MRTYELSIVDPIWFERIGKANRLIGVQERSDRKSIIIVQIVWGLKLFQ